VLALMVTALTTVTTAADAPDQSGTEMLRSARRSYVNILVRGRMVGSGCWISRHGDVLTAVHVLGRANEGIEILTMAERRIKAKIVAVDLGADLALLRVEGSKDDFPALQLAKKKPVVGEKLHLFGAPLFRRGLVTSGTVATDTPSFEYAEGQYIESMLIAGFGPPGTSGGPWINRRGRLVGVQSASVTIGYAPQGFAAAATLSAIERLLSTREDATVTGFGAAVEELWQQELALLDQLPEGTTGLLVRILEKGGPADLAGVAQWDIIQSIDGKPTTTINQFLRYVRGKTPGEEIELELVDRRGKNPHTATIALGQIIRRPLSPPDEPKDQKKVAEPKPN